MPTLHNQTKNALSWDMGGKQYACESWGPVDVPEKFSTIVKQYGLPLAAVPVPPEHRAQQRVVDEQESAKSDVLKALKAEIDASNARARVAAEELERCQSQLEESRTKVLAMSKELDTLKRELVAVKADKKAAEDLLAETARSATDAEEKALKAEALLKEAKKSSKK
jgi:hypothetical protein